MIKNLFLKLSVNTSRQGSLNHGSEGHGITDIFLPVNQVVAMRTRLGLLLTFQICYKE